MLLLTPDTAPGWWIGVVSQPPEAETPGDFYADEWELPMRLTEEWGLQWLPRNPEEEAIESEVFGWRPFRGETWSGAAEIVPGAVD